METLSIKKESALKAHENAGNKGKKLLEDLLGKKVFQKNIMERIKTFEDVLKELGEKDPDVIEYRKLQKVGVAEYILANQEIILIAKVLNEGWIPNWNDNSEYKYFPWFKMGSSGSEFSYDGYDRWYAGSLCGSRLCFKNYDLAKYAGTQFTEVFEKSMLIK